jgi:hypothetical protein
MPSTQGFSCKCSPVCHTVAPVCDSFRVDRRLADHIRTLCSKLINAEDEEEFESLATELRASLKEHVERLRSKLRDYPVTVERRSSPQ